MFKTAAILIVFFGAGQERTTISEQFETVELCEQAYTAIKEKYGTYSGNFRKAGNWIDPDASGCISLPK
jgi:hypothetical protein